LGQNALDYLPCRYGTSSVPFRGPKRDLGGEYAAFIGGTEVYGRFIEQPFPVLLEQQLRTSCVNLGVPNAGIDVFAHDAAVGQALKQAQVTVVQVLGAHNLTNKYYAVHPRRNDRFISASSLLQSIYPEVDFADFHYTKHLVSRLSALSPERFAPVRAELQRAWVARMRLLLGRIKGASVVLWFARDRPRGADPDVIDPHNDPLLVNREMLRKVALEATALVEVVVSDAAQQAQTEGMIFDDLEAPAAAQMLNPMAHTEAVGALAPVLRSLV